MYLFIQRFSFVILLLISFSAQAQGIKFFDGTWEDVLAEAKAKSQLVFVDAYTEWCGPCKMMTRNTFPNQEVGDFFEGKFVSYKFDMEKGEGPEFANRYSVNAYPTLLFINYKGELVHKGLGYRGPQELIKLAEEALSPAKNKETLALAYEAGTSNPQKLYDYALTLKQTGEDYQEVADKYFAAQSEKDLISPGNWEAIQTLVTKIDSREFQYLISKRKKFAKVYGSDVVDAKIQEVCKANTLEAAAQDDPKFYRAALNVALDHLEDDGETASRLRLLYAEATENWQDYTFKAIIHFDNYSITDPDELSNAAWNLYAYAPDERHLDKAASWVKQATVIDNTYQNQKVYAYVLYKSEDLRLALPTAFKARSMAEEEGIDTAEMDQLIQDIKDASKN